MGTQPRWVQTPRQEDSISSEQVNRPTKPTQHDKPLGLLNTVAIGLRITQALPFDLVGLVDFILRAVADEDGLSTPLDDHLFRLSEDETETETESSQFW